MFGEKDAHVTNQFGIHFHSEFYQTNPSMRIQLSTEFDLFRRSSHVRITIGNDDFECRQTHSQHQRRTFLMWVSPSHNIKRSYTTSFCCSVDMYSRRTKLLAMLAGSRQDHLTPKQQETAGWPSVKIHWDSCREASFQICVAVHRNIAQ